MIDKRELSIGTHVLIKGVREEIAGITPSQINDNGLEPIPITFDLLEEFGCEKFFEQDKVYWKKNFSNGMYAIIHIDTNYCVVRIKTHFSVYDIFHFKYLHELEAFVYLTTKQKF